MSKKSKNKRQGIFAMLGIREKIGGSQKKVDKEIWKK